MPGESFWNAPSGKGEDSDQDTFILVSSSDFDTQSSLENLSFVGPSAMATKLSGGSPDKPGPSGLGEGSRDARTDAGHSQAHGVGHQGLASGSSTGGGGGGGGDRRGGDRRLPTGDQNIEDDSHEPRASGSSTSSGSIQGLAPVDPALDINTADLWPNISASERNGHSDESGLSQATTAIVSDSETVDMAMQNNPIVNPLLGSTSSSSTSTSGSKVIKSSSINLSDISSAAMSTLSSGVSSSSSFEEKKSITDTSLSRMDTSTIDISGDNTVEGLLANDGKLDEFHSSHIDIFNNSAERFTSTPAEEIGIIDFHQTDMLETSEDNEMVIPSTQEEELEKISFVIPNAPLPSTSGSLKRRADEANDESSSSRKLLRPTLKLPILNATKNEQAGSKKLSEKAIAMDKIGQFIERGLKTPESNETVVEQSKNEGNLSVDDVESNANFDKQLPSTAINRKLLFESSQSSSDPSSSGGESSFQPVVAEPSCPNNNENVTASVVPETGGTLISMVLEDLASLEEASKPESVLATKDEMQLTGKAADASEIIESSQDVESQNIIESSQPSVIKRLASKPAVMDKDNFQLRYSPTLQDMESQYFPFGEEEKPSVGELEPKLNDFPTSVKTVTKPNDESLYEVPESEVSVVETFIHHAKSSTNEDSTLIDTKAGDELIIPSSLDDTVVPSTYESQEAKKNAELPIATVSQSDNASKADVEICRPSDKVASGKIADGKRDLEPIDEEDERLDEVSRHKRRKLCVNDETPSLPSTSGAVGESTNSSNYRSKENYNSKANESLSPTHLPHNLHMRDQEVQTIESLADLGKTPSGSGQSDSVIRRKTVLVKRIIVEEFIRNGRVYKKTTEEVNEDPLVTEYYENNESPKTFVSPLPVEKGSPLGLLSTADSSSCISSTERSGTSSGWLGDVSASVSKSSSSSSATKVPTKGMTPRLSLSASGDSPSSGSLLGMKTLRSVRRRQFSEFKKTLHLSPDKSVAGDVASSTPKSVSESSSKTSKGDGKGHKVVDPKRSPQSADKGSAKRKKGKRKTKAAGARNLSNEEKSPTPKKRGTNSDIDKDSPPREQLILKLNLKSSSIVSQRFDDSRTLKPGVRVLAKYRDGYYYPGSAVDQERHDRWKILYDDGDTRSIRAENILVVELLPVGQSIYVLSQDGFYDSAIIVGYLEVNSEIQYAIEMDGGTKRQVKQKEVILTTDQAACMEKLPLGTMHGYTSICLDNIIEGKRRSRDLVLESSSSKSSRRERNAVSASPSTNSANDESDHSSTHFKSSK